jgi:hypothetical protein
MADITVTAAQVGLVDPTKAEVKTYIAAATITKGQAVYLTTSGTTGVADASSGGGALIQGRGVALCGGGAGQAIDVLHDGEVYGFSVSSMNVGAIVYLSNTAGALADAAGDVTVRLGRVTCLADKSATKVVRIAVDWAAADWS